MLFFFPRDVWDEILNLIESVSEGFASYFGMLQIKTMAYLQTKNDMRIPADINDIHSVTQTVSDQAIEGITSKFKSVFEGIEESKI